MVEASPDIGPQNGVRRPCGASAALSAAHVQPGSTVTVISSPLTASTRFIRVMSSDSVWSLTGMWLLV